MENMNVVVIADTALFDLGVSVGFGAVIGAFLALFLYQSFGFLWDKVAALLTQKKSS